MLTGKNLIERGWTTGPALGQALKRANQVLTNGGTLEDAYAAAGSPPEPPKTLPLRQTPISMSEALGQAETEEERENQVMVRESMARLLRVPVVTGAAIMPDACPAGAEPITVGGVAALENAISPAMHSSDACCSMCASFFPAFRPHEMQMEALLGVTRFGPGGRPESEWLDHAILAKRDDSNPFLKGLDRAARAFLGTQGDGNHFGFLGTIHINEGLIRNLRGVGYDSLADYLQAGSEGLPFMHVLVTHHGSRGFGAQVFKRGKEVALEFAEKLCPSTPKGTEWIPFDTPEGRAYWNALQYVGQWTQANHDLIHDRFLATLGFQSERDGGPHKIARIFNAHNFVWRRGDTFYHGKGATPAWKDASGLPLLGLIPMNMASPILLVAGADNKDFLSFAPHGAGRNRSRTATVRSYASPEDLEQAVKTCTQGIDVRWFSGRPDPAETPLGYKSAEKVKAEIQQFGLANVLGEITPYGCVMAGEQPPPPWKQERERRES